MLIEYFYEPCVALGWWGVDKRCVAPALREVTITQWHEMLQSMTSGGLVLDMWSDNRKVVTSCLGTILQGSLCPHCWRRTPDLLFGSGPSASESSGCSCTCLSKMVRRLAIALQVHGDLPCLARPEQRSRSPALACAWRPPQTRRHRASRRRAKGRTRSTPARPSAPMSAPRAWQGRVPCAAADDAQAPGDHFLRGPAVS